MTNKNLEQHSKHQASYHKRRKEGFKPMPKAWDWLSLSDVQKLAVEAYKAASYSVHHEADEHWKTRESFANELVHVFGYFMADAAAKAGMSVTVIDHIGPNEQAVIDHVSDMRSLHSAWRPQYPVYQKVMPASAANTPGIVTNVDEGNVNDQHCK